jgi:hypothetical protein
MNDIEGCIKPPRTFGWLLKSKPRLVRGCAYF